MNTGRVFIIDDDETACQMAKRALEAAGFEAQSSTHVIGVTAQINNFNPHVILLDIVMPALSGDKLVELFAKGLKTLPKIILYSNKNQDELRKMARELGVSDFVCKTDGPRAMVEKVRKYMPLA